MLDSLISAGANLLGGLFGQSTADKNREQQAALAQQNMAMQKEFAQSGIQWKVEDAKKAGIHPLYAVGAQGASFSPVSMTTDSSNPMGEAIAKSGQDIAGAMQRTQNSTDKVDAVMKTQQGLATQKMGLENELLSTQIAKAKKDLIGPGIPALNERYAIPGQGSTAGFTPKWEEKNERVTPDPQQPHKESFAVTDMGHSKTQHGYSAIPSKDVQERIEDNWIQQMMWAVRNNLYPTFGYNESPPPVPTKPGYTWKYSGMNQEYRQMRKVPYLPIYY